MSKNDCIIRLERKDEHREIENLVRESFWNVYRPGCLEHYVLHTYRMRDEFIPELSFVMEKDGKIIGYVMYSKAQINSDDGRIIPIMTMGPIGILPEYKRQGFGKMLLDYSMERAKALGAGALCFEGNIDFYGKSGFVIASTKGIHYYDEPRENEVPYFLLKELEEGYLSGIEGVYRTPEGYFVDENEAESFDLTFPPKEKKKLPGQIF